MKGQVKQDVLGSGKSDVNKGARAAGRERKILLWRDVNAHPIKMHDTSEPFTNGK